MVVQAEALLTNLTVHQDKVDGLLAAAVVVQPLSI
jgi:hypothetical protein